MNVAMLSDQEITGGAAIAASRLARALAAKGVKISRIIGISDTKSSFKVWDRYHVFPNLTGGYIPKVIEKASIHYLTHLYTKISAHRIEMVLRKLKPDIINIHNIHGAGWSPEIVRSCLAFAPVVWTLHDMWSFTGRCAYSYDCQKFLNGCDHLCPTADEYPHTFRRDIASSWKIRQQLLQMNTENLAAVTPSHWLATIARKGLWRGHRIEVIPNGLPLHLYRPEERDTARAALDIEGDGPFILAAAQYLFERRKGGYLFLEALQKMDENLPIITFGMDKIEGVNLKNKIFNLGFIPEDKKIQALNAADCYIHPAPVDNLPNVVMEAIACGTPVVGFDVGGVPEMVRELETGWLASEISGESLLQAMNRGINDVTSGLDLRRSCRSVAVNEYDVNIQAERYIELFNSIRSA